MAIAVTHPTRKSLPKIGMLVGRETTLTPSKASFEKGRNYAIGYYRTDEGEIAAIAACDVEFCCYAGGALSLIPAGRAKEAIATGEIDGSLRENAHEVLNVCALALRSEQTNLRLREMEIETAPLAADAADFIKSAGKNVAVDVTVDGYGSGSMTLYFG